MSDDVQPEDARHAVLRATRAMARSGSSRAARFVLLSPADGDRAELTGRIADDFATMGASVGSLSPQDGRALLLVLAAREFADRAAAFDAAYALADAYGLQQAEPDYDMGFFPEQSERGPVAESIDSFPGCWVDADPALDARPRWALESLRVPEAWAYSIAEGRPAKGADIVIAQPDTGIAVHPELDGVPRIAGHDFLDGDSDVTDPMDYMGQRGHGTTAASVVVSPDTQVVWGTAPAASHMPIRAIETVMRISQVNVARAIDFAVAQGAPIVSMSLGGAPSIALGRALDRAVAADTIVLAAAGNCVRHVVWPARYDACIAIAGCNVRDEIWRGSCRGSDVDATAPAENVWRARVDPEEVPSQSVSQGQGTTFAVAMVAGVAALWLAHYGRAVLVAAARQRGEKLQEMFRRLMIATARRPAGWNTAEFGAGIVDARALLAADFDLGLGAPVAEAAVAAVAGADSAQGLVREAVSPEAARAPIDWDRYGPEIAALVLEQSMPRPAAAAPEAAYAAKATMSESLASAMAGTSLAASMPR